LLHQPRSQLLLAVSEMMVTNQVLALELLKQS
jgi:hypothetical protein